ETQGKLPFSSDNITVYFDAAAVGDALELRPIRPQDVFRPLGSLGQHNLTEYLKKQKKDAPLQGIVAKPNGEVVWIPGVQISQTMRVTPQTREILKISYTGI
ncbi:MAG TPA: tRNA lysidine(34) synthetase TilS C-terminal domain-containing protein, partial [Chitinivibrionales bacterium]